MSKPNGIATLPSTEQQIIAASDVAQLISYLEGMEPGLIVWDEEERCAFFSDRLVEVLGMRKTDIAIGQSRESFLESSLDRGEINQTSLESIKAHFSRRNSFQFDRQLRTGKVVSTRARPFGERGFVVTFTDVTNERVKAQEMDDSIRAADEARRELAVTLGLEKSRQYEARLLNEFGDWLQSCKSLEELYTVVKRYLEEKLPGSQGELYIYSNSRDVLEGILSWGRAKLQDHISAGSCWGLRRGRSYRFSNEEICFECGHVAAVKHLQVDEYTCIPIVAHGDTVGLLHVRYPASGKVESQIKNPSKFASKCAELVSLAIANVRLRDELHEQSTRDALTGLRNRRYCIDTLASLQAAHQRGGEGFSVISLDVDKFKDFNDNFGHDAGDAVLQCISRTMRTTIAEGCDPCRFGGEEFLIVLPNMGLETAARAAEVMRKAVMSTQTTYAGKPLPQVTISCGVASFPQTSNTVQGVLREADLALYRAKDMGRNCVEIAKD